VRQVGQLPRINTVQS